MTTTQTTETTKVRYLTRCPSCQTAHAVDVEAGSYFVNDAFNERLQDCRNCGRWLRVWKRVNGKFSASRKCDSRCTGAIGHNCECQCGGANHGADAL